MESKVIISNLPGTTCIVTFFLLINACTNAQENNATTENNPFLYTPSELAALMIKPVCMGEHQPSQAGPLRMPDGNGGFKRDSTFTVEKVRIRSDGFFLTGWLYLPPGDKRCPLIIMTNGGGNVVSQIRSFSDFMAPVLAHCGYAAFVHDKRGTGESEGDYVRTTYDDYINDAGNCAVFLSKHVRIDPDNIGVMGASEGGRVAVVAASRFPVFSFVISHAGTMVGAIEDRLNAQLNGLIDGGQLTKSKAAQVEHVWRSSFEAWASRDPEQHKKVNEEIMQLRKIYPRNNLPFTKEEMETIPEFANVLPTWNSLNADYMTEMEHFTKKWLAIYGAEDRVVPTGESIKNIHHYMELSGNQNCSIAVIPRMGHVPVDIETKRRLNFENLIINWLTKNVPVKQ